MTEASSDIDSLVWHYTNSAGVLGMVGDRQLWATHYQFVNDKQEGSVFDEAMSALLNSDELDFPEQDLLKRLYRPPEAGVESGFTRVTGQNRFLLCGSASGDELTLWRNYAREDVSYAVGFDPTAPLGVIPPKANINVNVNVFPWKVVDYQPALSTVPALYMRRIRDGLKQPNGGAQIGKIQEVLLDMLCVAKSEAFKDERESRVVCLADNTDLWRFRPGRLGITPYVALGSAKEWGEGSTGEESLPIRAIRLSANASEADMLALNALLEANGFAGRVEVDFDDTGRPVFGTARAFEPPVRILKASNSLRL